MGSVIPPGLVAEDCVIPAKANAAMETRFPFLLKGIEPSRFEAGRADRSRATEIGGFCGMRRVGRKIFWYLLGCIFGCNFFCLSGFG